MARQKTLQCMFKPIDREEMHVHVEREVESLGKRLKLESYGEASYIIVILGTL